MLELDFEQLIRKVIVLRPPSKKIVHTFYFNQVVNLDRYICVFYLIVHPMSPTERFNLELDLE